VQKLQQQYMELCQQQLKAKHVEDAELVNRLSEELEKTKEKVGALR
jgi:hypothetical protein